MSNGQELLRTTSLKGLAAARTGGPNPVDAYPLVIERIRKQCGADVATLFAEPALPANAAPDDPQITWYTSLTGQMVEVADIDEVARRPVLNRLRDRLQRLGPVLADPEIGATVASWLYIPSANDLLSVGGNPVLINWGHVPQDIAASATQRETHFAETIGRYATGMPTPPFTLQEAASYNARPTRATAAAPVAAASPAAPAVAAAEVVARPRAFRAWAPLIASLLAAAVLVFLLIPGVLVRPNQLSSAEVDRQTALLREDNRALAERAQQLEEAAKSRTCRLPNGQLSPLTPIPNTPGQPAAPATPRADLLPPPPEKVELPPAANAPTNTPASLSGVADQAVVFIYGRTTDGGVGLGSGFFVTKNRIVTNRHVVEHLIPDSIKVTNKAMGHAVPATVVAETPPESNNLSVQDFAILGVEQPASATLKLGPSVTKGSSVIAVGYPGYLVETDPSFQRLLHGDLSASPENVIEVGFVMQKRDSDPVKIVTHSANLGRGNSGGPLMDYCGRVVGVNTAVINEGQLSTTANLAQDVQELRSFLSTKGITPEVDDAQKQCPPAAVASTSPPANAPAPAANAPAAAPPAPAANPPAGAPQPPAAPNPPVAPAPR